jgi:hypothetical protein
MNCPEICAALPELLYGELKPAQVETVQSHLAGCAGCQAELAGLRQVSGLLDKLPVPAVRVHVGQIYWQSQVRQECRLRRWRRATFALTAIAAAVVLAMLLQLEVRVDGRQLVLRWGSAREVITRVAPEHGIGVRKQHQQSVSVPPEVTRADLKLMRDLLHAVAADVDGRDRLQHESLAAIQRQLDRLEQEAQQRWTATVRYVAANTRSENQEKEGVNP